MIKQAANTLTVITWSRGVFVVWTVAWSARFQIIFVKFPISSSRAFQIILYIDVIFSENVTLQQKKRKSLIGTFPTNKANKPRHGQLTRRFKNKKLLWAMGGTENYVPRSKKILFKRKRQKTRKRRNEIRERRMRWWK